ncbi:MAG: hypothetical protein WC002_10595 [Candidatus Muiribacteriota bacterium]|jgi:hypothetical protein
MKIFIEEIYNKDRNIRKKGLISLTTADFSILGKNEIQKLHSQLEKIIAHDEADITFFARKVLLSLEQYLNENKINFRGDPVNELYEKKADELITLLNTDEKLVRINAIYALAKTGSSEKHIKSLENFAEIASEDEASLAIDSIMAIKKFIKDRAEKEKEREQTRKKTLEILNTSKKEKKIFNPASNTLPEIHENNKFDKKNLILIFFLSSAALIFIYFSLIFNPSAYISSNSEIIFISKYRINPVIVFRENSTVKIIRLKLSLTGWKHEEL